LPALKKEYPEGMSDETITESNRTIYRTIVKLASKQEVYSKVVYSYGVFYFKENTSISQSTYDTDLKRIRESLKGK
jgi:L-ribulose-5-phosphate 3-epimerase UlaE